MIEMMQQAGLQQIRWRPLPFEPAAKGPPLFVASASAADGTNTVNPLNNVNNIHHKEILP
jgi:hypothetical protein